MISYPAHLEGIMRSLAKRLGLLLMLSMTTVAHAELLQPGQVYSGGTNLDIASLGLSLTVPIGWTALLPPGSSVLVMTPDDQSYVLATADHTTLDEVRSGLSDPLALGNGVVLSPIGTPLQTGQDLRVSYTVTGLPMVYEGDGRSRAVSNEVVVSVIALAVTGALDPTRVVADQFLDSMQVSSKPTAATNTENNDDWHSYLQGRHLVRYFGDSSYNETQHIYLCANGRFRKTFGSGGHTSYGDGWSSGAMASADSGQWHASGTGNQGSLVLQFTGGGRSEVYLEYRDNKVYLDGVQWLRDPENSYCG
ncbi:MAG: hypothetical protein AAGA73_07210 [Pseudomonadota bacterium]